MPIDTTVRCWCKHCERATTSAPCKLECAPYMTACAGCGLCSECGYDPATGDGGER